MSEHSQERRIFPLVKGGEVSLQRKLIADYNSHLDTTWVVTYSEQKYNLAVTFETFDAWVTAPKPIERPTGDCRVDP